MAITAETRNDIIELVVTAYDAAPGTTLLTELVAIVDGGGTLADVAANLTTSDTWTSLYPSFQTAEEFANEWLGNLVPEASADALAEGVSVAVGLINGGASFADLILEAQSFLSATSETDASFGTSAANFNNKTEVAIHHTVTQERDGDLGALQTAIASVTSDDTTVDSAKAEIDGNAGVGSTTTLTSSVDTVSGTPGNDTVKGVVSSTAGQTTLGAGDNINGQGGTDTLEIIFDGTGDFGPVATVANTEVFLLKNFGTATNDANLANITGIEQVWNDGSTQAVNVTNLGSLPTIGIRNTVVDTDVTFTNAALAGSSDSVTVLLDSVNNTATDVTLGNTSGTEGVETVVVNSSGSSANRLNSLNSDQSDFTTLTVMGTQALTLDSVDSTLTTIDASALGAGLTATISAATTANDVSFIGSASADSITVGTTTQADTIDGGDGTDTLTSAGTFGATVSNVEALVQLVAGADADISADFDKAQSIASLTVTSSGTTATFQTLTVTNLAANPSITLISNGASDFDKAASAISLKTSTGSSDTVTLNFQGNGSYTFSDNDIDVAGIENIVVNSTASGTWLNSQADLFSQATDVLKKVTFTGSSKIDIDATLSASTSAIEIDGSALTGILDIAAAPTGGTLTIKGGSGNDVLTGGANGDTITTGGGNNTVNGGGGADTITGGSGNDTIVQGAGADSITSGSGSDTIQFDTVAGGPDTITDWSSSGDDLRFDDVSFTLGGDDTNGIDAYFEGAIGTATAGTDYDVMVLTGASYANEAAAGAAVAGQITSDGKDGLIVYHDSDDNVVRIIHTTDMGADGTETLVATISNVTTLAGVAAAFAQSDFVSFT